MTTTITPETATRPRNRGLVAVFAITQPVGYGVHYYAFSVLLTPRSASLGARRFEPRCASCVRGFSRRAWLR